MSELADESDSKSDGKPCGFDPHYPHWIIVDTLLRCVYCALYVLFLKTHFWHTFHLRQSLFSPIIRRLHDVKSKDSKSATSFLLILKSRTITLIIMPKIAYNAWIYPAVLLINQIIYFYIWNKYVLFYHQNTPKITVLTHFQTHFFRTTIDIYILI